MICPKRRWSKERTHTRRAKWKLDAPNIVRCPQCHGYKLSHIVCGECGFYKGKEIIKMSAEA